MVTNISDLSDIQTVVVLYPAGSSGEMTGYLLTQTLDDVSKTSAMHWENSHRCKFLDFYDRSLTSGWETIPDQIVVDGVNRYLTKVTCEKRYHVGLSHPNLESIAFLQAHAAHCPVIEICTTTETSLKFCYIASQRKIDIPVAPNPNSKYKHSLSANQHLKLEWSDLFLDDVVGSFNKITKFLNTTGNLESFKTHIDNYLIRNTEILNAIN